jgi:hypothetical protein
MASLSQNRGLAIGLVLLLPVQLSADNIEERKAALRPFNDLVGSWRATGTPEGTREEKQRGFWTENLEWRWQFKNDDAWLAVDFTKGKYFTSGELRFLTEKKVYELTLQTPSKDKLVFTGQLKGRVLTVERTGQDESQRLTITLLHSNRFLYASEFKSAKSKRFIRQYQVGATKEGVAFAGPADNALECIVTGGLGKIQVSHKGKTYYVCCSGCRDVFMEDPEKCIREAAERKKKESADGKR